MRGGEDLYIDEVHTALDIFRFAVFFTTHFKISTIFVKLKLMTHTILHFVGLSGPFDLICCLLSFPRRNPVIVHSRCLPVFLFKLATFP